MKLLRAISNAAAIPMAAVVASGLWATSVSAAPAEQGPMKIVVSIADQTMDVYVGERFIERLPVSTGMAGHSTPTGVFSILEKRRFHNSNIYSGAPMPFMQRLTWSGIALHAGRLPGYPASHGCIRIAERDAASLFQRTRAGAHVIVAPTRLTPLRITHEALPNPASRTAAAPSPRLASLAVGDTQTASDAPPPSPAPEKAAPEEVFSEAPVRVLLTRRSGRERLRDVQNTLRELGYYDAEADGYMGPRTGAAIGAFQAAQGLPQTRAMSDELVARVYAAAGKGPAPTGHLYVRQDFKPVFDMPVVIADTQAPLGTHVFTAVEVDRAR
ncbi:MAG: L,D-transpeptidase family protein, partial [Beijerinckiaceae bacterium]|nr:L,D-transpeptidase family protein [Beijerinckiaceae bacterium]